MSRFRITFASFCLLALAVGGVLVAPADAAEGVTQCEPTARYCLFNTSNIWTFILLDTTNGRAWQIAFSVEEDIPPVRTVINASSLLPEGGASKAGRFTLYPTQNMYTFLLLDRSDSRVWQLQWSWESENRGIVRSIP